MDEYREAAGGRFKVSCTGDHVLRIQNGEERAVTISRTGNNGNYRSVSCPENGKRKHYLVHRLVAEAFIPNPNNYPEVNHLDGNGHNNNLENLEWCTAQQNIQHVLRMGLRVLHKKVIPYEKLPFGWVRLQEIDNTEEKA